MGSNIDKLPWRIAGLGATILLWQLLVSFKVVSTLLLPSPWRVVETIGKQIQSELFWRAFFTTTATWLFGCILGILIGSVIGTGLGASRIIWKATEPIVEFLRSLPSVILVPLVSLLLGSGSYSRLVATTLAVALIIIASGASSFNYARASYARLVFAWKLTRVQAFTQIYLPSIFSYMALAAKNAIPIGLVVAVAAEMLVATDNGIGKMLMDSMAVFDTPTFFSLTIEIGLLGYGSAIAAKFIEKRIVHWREV